MIPSLGGRHARLTAPDRTVLVGFLKKAESPEADGGSVDEAWSRSMAGPIAAFPTARSKPVATGPAPGAAPGCTAERSRLSDLRSESDTVPVSFVSRRHL